MLTGINVLVIEDYPQLANVMRKVLTRKGAQVSFAETGQAGLAPSADGAPHVIVCDYNLPDGTADQFLPRLRALYPHAKLIVSSGEPLDQPGWDDCLAKPFSMDRLVEAVAALAHTPAA